MITTDQFSKPYRHKDSLYSYKTNKTLKWNVVIHVYHVHVTSPTIPYVLNNPSYNFSCRDELTLGHRKKPTYKKMAEVVLGDKAYDIRAKLPQKGLTPEQQVACLLNQATDPSILGRVWVGWEPWMWSRIMWYVNIIMWSLSHFRQFTMDLWIQLCAIISCPRDGAQVQCLKK